MSGINTQTVLPQTPSTEPAAPDYRWMTMAIESDPEIRERMKSVFTGQQQPVQPVQPAAPAAPDPIASLEAEIQQLESSLPPSIEAAVQSAGTDPNKAQAAAADFWSKQSQLTQKLNALTRLRNDRLAGYEAQTRAQQMLPEIIRQAGPQYQSLVSSPAELQAFQSHLDQLGLPAESRMNPLVLQTVAGAYLYNRASGPKPGPSLASSQGGTIPPQPQTPTDIQISLANYAGIDVAKLMSTDQVTLGPKPNMTLRQKQLMLP